MPKRLLPIIAQTRDTFSFSRKNILFLFSITLIVGNVADLIFGVTTTEIFYINGANLILIFLILILYFTKKIAPNNALSVLIYTMLFNNIVSSLIIPVVQTNFSSDFLRNVLILSIMIPFIAFINGRIHILIVGAIFYIFLGIAIKFSHDSYLINNVFMICVIMLAYIIGIYIIIKRLEENQNEKEELNNQLTESNQELLAKAELLADINEILAEKNQQIEKQTQELKLLLATRDKFYSIIAHDIKNPMGAIMGFADLLNKKMQPCNDPRLLRYADMIKKTSTQSFTLLVSLLEWTRLQTGQVEVNPELFNLYEILQQLLEVIRVSAAEKNIQLSCQSEEEITVFADKNMISTAMRNFISNAIKFTPQDGKVSVSIAQSTNSVMFSVTDTGIGIEKEEIQKFFNNELVNKRDGTNKEMGTGLGLMLCKDFINLHKGVITIESSPNLGSKFAFSIPNHY